MSLRRLNIKIENKSKLVMDADKIPNLVPGTILKQWMKDDPDPFYKIQAIDYPIVANRLVYKESFFEEYISKLSSRPIPGSKAGHEMAWGKRPKTDFILIGAKIQKKGDGKGTVFLKNYIPLQGESGDNTIFIRENKSDMIHFSMVSWTKDIIEQDEDGNQIVNVVGSIKGERNDAVEFGLGAMEQKTNENKDNAGVASIKKTNIGVSMDKNELLKKLKAFKDNGDLTLLEVAKIMSLEKQLITDEQKTALSVMAEFKKLKVEKPVEEFIEMHKRIEKNNTAVFDAIITEELGTEKFQNGKENLHRKYCVSQLKDVQIEKLKERIAEIKKDSVAIKLAGDKADYMSDQNNLGRVEQNKTNQEDADENTGTRIDKV